MLVFIHELYVDFVSYAIKSCVRVCVCVSHVTIVYVHLYVHIHTGFVVYEYTTDTNEPTDFLQ